MHKMIYVVGTNAPGGISNVIADHCSYYKSRDLDFKRIVSHNGRGKLIDLLIFIRAIFVICIGLCRESVDYFHLHMSYNGSFWRKLLFMQIGTIFDVKIIVHLHGSEFHQYVDRSPKYRLMLIKHLISKSHTFIVLSKGWGDYVSRISSGNVVSIPNFIEPIEQSQSSSRKNDFLFIGALIDRKDPLIAIKAYYQANCTGDLYICGDGPLLASAKVLACELGIASRVIFCGWVGANRKFELLNQCKFLLLPSHNEGFPLTIIEALAAKCLVISTKVGAIPEYIIDGHNGFLFESGNCSELAEILHGIENCDLDKIVSNGFTTYLDNFTASAAYDLLDRVYGLKN